MELYRNIDLLHPADDNKTLAQTDQRDKIVRSIGIEFLFLTIL